MTDKEKIIEAMINCGYEIEDLDTAILVHTGEKTTTWFFNPDESIDKNCIGIWQ